LTKRFVLAFYGTRGDVEPGIAVGRELARRGHQVTMALPPDAAPLAESVGLRTIPYGPDTRTWLDDTRDFWGYLFRNFWRIGAVRRHLRESREPGVRAWTDMTRALAAAADGADLLVTGISYEELAFDVAEYRDVPLATVLWFPMRVNGRLLPRVPAVLLRPLMRGYEWLIWLGVRRMVADQRRALGLAPATRPVPDRIAERNVLEIQAYDAACFPGLAEEWRRWGDRRPFVGALTLQLDTDADADVLAWIEAGTPPICFGFGSIPVRSPAETLAMIARACARVGERALVCAGWSDFTDVPEYEHVKLVRSVNYAAVFPRCRAVVHHGGAGTTAAGLRAGVPTLVLWMADVQVIWGAAVRRLGVGAARRFAATTEETLVRDLRTVLAPRCREAARRLAGRMTPPDESVRAAANHLEAAAGG